MNKLNNKTFPVLSKKVIEEIKEMLSYIEYKYNNFEETTLAEDEFYYDFKGVNLCKTDV